MKWVIYNSSIYYYEQEKKKLLLKTQLSNCIVNPPVLKILLITYGDLYYIYFKIP